MNVVSLLVAHAQSTVLEEPCERGLDHPSVLPQTADGLGVAPGNEWFNASSSQRLTDLLLGVVRSISEDGVGTLAGATTRTFDRRNGINQSDRHLRIVDVRPGVLDRQRRAVAVRDQMPFRAVLLSDL